MDHLIIGGTGAVGVTWAQILHKAGDNVSVYVRPKYATEIEANGGALTTFDIKKAAGLNFALLAAATVVSYIGLRIAFEPFCCAWFVAFLLGAAIRYALRAQVPAPTALKIPIKEVITDVAPGSKKGTQFDFIWVCLASTSLKEPGFIKSIASTYPNSTIVGVVAGLTDAKVLLEEVAAVDGMEKARSRVLSSSIPIVSYGVPIPEETYTLIPKIGADHSVAAGVAVFIYAAATLGYHAESKDAGAASASAPAGQSASVRARLAQATLTLGGMQTNLKNTVNVTSTMGPVPYLFPVMVMSIEAAQWKFLRVLGKVGENDAGYTPALAQASPLAFPSPFHLVNVYYRALTALNIFARSKGAEGLEPGVPASAAPASSSGSSGAAATPADIPITQKLGAIAVAAFLVVIVTISPMLMPLDFEAYIKYHFLKVGDQSLMHVRDHIARGKKNGAFVDGFVDLEKIIQAKRGKKQA